MLRQPITPIAFAKSDDQGVALILKDFKPLALSGDINHLRFLSSIFRIGELITLRPSYDYTTIHSPQSEEQITYTDEFCKDFGKWLKNWKVLKLIPDLNKPRFPLKNSTGPNTTKENPYGASVLFLHDLSAIIDQEFSSSIYQMLDLHYDFRKAEILEGKFSHSRIVSLQDKFGKERVIAIGDIISNWALSPFEDAVQKSLKSMRTSMAYKQGLVPKAVERLGLELYSIDLSAMTDRFPRKLQFEVLKARFGSELANIWLDIMTNREFETVKGDKIRYEVGNPMGFLSSWSVSTLTHHAVVEYLAQKLRIHNISNKYIMLGDDLVLSNKVLYIKYKDVMTKLGLSISTPKCTISQEGYAEFAKRLFTPKGEITGFPVNQTLEGIKDIVQFIGLIKTLDHRGYSYTSHPSLSNHLLVNTEKSVKTAFRFIQRLPGNTFCLPQMWVGPTVFNYSVEQLLVAQDYVQAKEIRELPNKISKIRMVRDQQQNDLLFDNHPMFITLGNQIMEILIHDPDEYQTWEKWLEEDTRITIPVPEPYSRDILKTDKVLRRDLEIIKALKNQSNEPLPEKLSNLSIYQIIFGGW